jgi:hypothetical protein
MSSSDSQNILSQSIAEIAKLDCRFCGTRLKHSFVDLGLSPLCQKHVHAEELNAPETFFPLHAFVCDHCFLVQLGEYASPGEIFSDYHYLSSYSDSWLQHCENYTDNITTRLGLDTQSSVVELASNDGYLLQYFVKRDIPAYGIEPAENVAEIARQNGIDTVAVFFGEETARQLLAERGTADLLIGNNVLAHVPDINDFVAGMAILLDPLGTVTMEFPHLMRLVEENQFDTIYHEHFSYLSFSTVEKIFAAHGLTLYDVEELPTHGGSLRIYAKHAASARHPVTPAVEALREREISAGMQDLAYYGEFTKRVEKIRRDLLSFLIEAKNNDQVVVGYGAPGKGNTLLNYCGIRSDLVQYTVDRNPLKQGTFLPGTRIPVLSPESIDATRPDYVLILPWNLKAEIMKQLQHIRDWGGRFLTAIPGVQVIE